MIVCKLIKVSTIKANKNNPRVIKDYKFQKLVQSIKEFPKMMELRPMIVDNDNTVLGGNMRLKAIQELGLKDIPDTWIKKASELTDEEKYRFIIADNNNFGSWDWDALANKWDEEQLNDWGLDTLTNEGLLAKTYSANNAAYVDEKIPYPITIIVTKDDYEKWLQIKDKLEIFDDKKAFFKIISESSL